MMGTWYILDMQYISRTQIPFMDYFSCATLALVVFSIRLFLGRLGDKLRAQSGIELIEKRRNKTNAVKICYSKLNELLKDRKQLVKQARSSLISSGITPYRKIVKFSSF